MSAGRGPRLRLVLDRSVVPVMDAAVAPDVPAPTDAGTTDVVFADATDDLAARDASAPADQGAPRFGEEAGPSPGCVCRTSPRAAGGGWWLALLLAARRRRRR